ncbi:MAG: hypothetical protein ACI9P3_000524 [Bradyrhizobium sp.]|jgi:hypothetical protein|nr:hypothetical protein [Bradyrhizobium sp.]
MGSRTENDSALLRPQTTNFINAAFSVFPKNESHSSRATEAQFIAFVRGTLKRISYFSAAIDSPPSR